MAAKLDLVETGEESARSSTHEGSYRKQVQQLKRLIDTSGYLEGECNELGEFGYNRDGKRGKLQIVIGLLADPRRGSAGGARV